MSMYTSNPISYLYFTMYLASNYVFEFEFFSAAKRDFFGNLIMS